VRLAIVVGGWHWPLHFYETMAKIANGADLFVAAHRNPELAIVREEKRVILDLAEGPLADLDRRMYREYPTLKGLRKLGWDYEEKPNTIGDWGFFNQWMEDHYFERYDAILNCHDDNWIRRDDLVSMIKGMLGNDLLISNGRYPEAPAGYVRGSFEVWRRELLGMLGGRIDLGEVKLTRDGKTDTPPEFDVLSVWNDTCTPTRNFMRDRGLLDRIGYLSPHYRVSPWVIEGERGFLHYQGGAPWSFNKGLKAFPLKEQVIA
jgi:hypothetical protein